jgi:hypothetical protein
VGKTSEVCFSTYFDELNPNLKSVCPRKFLIMRYQSCRVCLSATVPDRQNVKFYPDSADTYRGIFGGPCMRRWRSLAKLLMLYPGRPHRCSFTQRFLILSNFWADICNHTPWCKGHGSVVALHPIRRKGHPLIVAYTRGCCNFRLDKIIVICSSSSTLPRPYPRLLLTLECLPRT